MYSSCDGARGYEAEYPSKHHSDNQAWKTGWWMLFPHVFSGVRLRMVFQHVFSLASREGRASVRSISFFVCTVRAIRLRTVFQHVFSGDPFVHGVPTRVSVGFCVCVVFQGVQERAFCFFLQGQSCSNTCLRRLLRVRGGQNERLVFFCRVRASLPSIPFHASRVTVSTLLCVPFPSAFVCAWFSRTCKNGHSVSLESGRACVQQTIIPFHASRMTMSFRHAYLTSRIDSANARVTRPLSIFADCAHVSPLADQVGHWKRGWTCSGVSRRCRQVFHGNVTVRISGNSLGAGCAAPSFYARALTPLLCAFLCCRHGLESEPEETADAGSRAMIVHALRRDGWVQLCASDLPSSKSLLFYCPINLSFERRAFQLR